MSWNKLFFQCLEFIAAGACSILFIFQLMDIWNHYVNKATYVAAENQPETPLALPIITICPVHAYKTNSFKSSLEGYLNNTYRLEEIFSNSTIQELNNETRFNLEAVHSRFHGRCFAIQDKLLVQESQPQLNTLTLNLLTSVEDVKIFLLEPSEEFYLMLDKYPYVINNVLVETGNGKGYLGADITITKEIFHKLPKESENGKGMSCYHNDIQELVDCTKQALRSTMMEKNTTCRIGLLKDLDLNDSLEYCEDGWEGLKGATEASHSLTGIWNQGQCKLPCKRVRNIAQVSYFHENALQIPGYGENGTFILWIFYETLRVMTKTELYVYGFDTALVAIGGSMGLYLGFSCLSILLFCLSTIQMKLGRPK